MPDLAAGVFALMLILATLSCVTSAPARADEPKVGEFKIPWALPLNADERQQLRTLIAEHPDAATRFAHTAERAKPLLGQPATPLDVIHYEGLVNTDPRRIQTVRSLKQMGDAAWVLRYWQATDDPQAAQTLRTWIAAWADTYSVTGNDVNENKLVPLLVAYIDFREDFESEDRDRIDRWVSAMGQHHARRARESEYLSNRFAKHLRIAAVAGLAVHEPDWLDAAREGVQRFVRGSLRPDGTSFDLEQRDTLTYHGSALKPMIELSILFERLEDHRETAKPLYHWTHENGASVATSVDYVVPFATGEKMRQEWKNSKVELDRQRAEAGLDYFEPGKLYDPRQAAELLDLASYYRPDLVPLVAKLTDRPADTRFPSWLSLNHAAVHAARAAQD